MYFFFQYDEEMPESFYSSENKQAPEECSVCGNKFGDKMYFIEKAFQRSHDRTEYHTTFEYAICEDCKNDMMQSISKESMKNIQEYALQLGEKKEDVAFLNEEINLNHQLTHCIASGKSIEELDEYHLVGVFKNNRLIHPPMVYGETFIEEYTELLSEETKGFFDDFFDSITVLPPSLAKILEDEKPKRPVFI